MSDSKKDDKKEEKKDAHGGAEGGAAAAKAGGMKGGMGAIIAGVILLAIGAGLGMATAKLVAKLSAGDPAEATAEGHEATTKKDEHAAGAEGHGGLHDLKEITLPELMSNIKNQQGRRYVKVACAVWITNADAMVLGFAGGGGHGGGGEAGGNIKRVIQQALEEHLKSYDLEELTGPHVYPQLKKGFRDAIERALHDVFPETADDHKFVERIVLTGLIVQ